ncbi:MAG TPA: hypothetical protein VF980_09750 [Thermoanaerobaculia bacterium]
MRQSAKLVIAAAVALAALLSTYGFFFFRDNLITHYPMKVISAHSFRSGEIPWWNFNDIGGQPLAGNPNALTFYPDNVLYLILPAHVAFNLHFLLHLAGGFLAMRALCGARGIDRRSSLFGATVWLLSGIAISTTCLYNLVTAVALVPLALYAVERSSTRILGLAFGLMLLAAEPVTLIGATVAVAIVGFRRVPLSKLAWAALIALAIGAPQIIAYSEIAGEVERVVPLKTGTVLITSLSPKRILEIFVWPLSGFLNDPDGNKQRLFSTIFLGVIAVPALWSRSRYTAVVAAMLFLAVGSYNPIIPPILERFPLTRVMRYPEKFAIPLETALVVLIAEYFGRTRWKREWTVITFLPLLWCAVRGIPIDWFAYYRVAPRPAVRVRAHGFAPPDSMNARTAYRIRARDLDWMFGAVAGLRYGVGRSPDLMHSVLSRTVAERYDSARPELQQRYLRIAGCNVPGHLPEAMVVPAAIGARGMIDAVNILEAPQFDEHRWAVAPISLHGFVSAPGRLNGYREDGQTIRIALDAPGPLLLFVNQTFFESWIARADDRELTTVPLDVDRLGVIVPAGTRTVTLTFGRHRGTVEATWAASAFLMIVLLLPKRVQKADRRTGEVERAGDEDGPLV